MVNKTAIIVTSHNSKLITDSLCESIKRNTRSPYDIYIVETGSKLDQLSSYTSLWSADGIRMTMGMNLGIQYALLKEQKNQNEFYYDSFWLVVNDTIFDEVDTLTPLVNFMRANKDCAEIHPYVKNSPSIYQRKDGIILYGAIKTSFIEFVCPLFSREIIEKCIFDNRYIYGWIDYEIPYTIHRSLKRVYKSNSVGVTHYAGTTTRIGGDEKFKGIEDQFKASRDNMMAVLIDKHGERWGNKFLEAIPPDVSIEPFVDWVTRIGQNYVF